MTNRVAEKDYLKISAASSDAPFSVSITDGKLETIEPDDHSFYELIELDDSRCFIFNLDENLIKIIASIREQKTNCTIELSPNLERLIIYNLAHFGSLLFFTCYHLDNDSDNDRDNKLFLAKTSLELDGDIIHQIRQFRQQDGLSNEIYQTVLTSHGWLVKKTINVFSEKIKDFVKSFNIVLSLAGIFSFIQASFSNNLNPNILVLLLIIFIGIIVIKKEKIKQEKEFGLLSGFKNSSRFRKDKLVDEQKFKWRSINVNSIVTEIATEIGDRQLSQSIFLVGFIIPRLATNQDTRNLLTLLVPIFIYLVIWAKDWIEKQRFFIRFKQKLKKSTPYPQILKFLNKFEITAFLIEMAIAAFLLGSLVPIDVVSIALLCVILICANLLNIQNLKLQYWWQNQERKLSNIIILRMFGGTILLTAIIGEGFLLGSGLSGFLNGLPIIIIQVILLTFIVMRIPNHLLSVLTKFFWQNVIPPIAQN